MPTQGSLPLEIRNTSAQPLLVNLPDNSSVLLTTNSSLEYIQDPAKFNRNVKPGLEIFYGIETRAPQNGACLVEAATGKIIWGFDKKTFHVHGQGMIGDIDPEHPGIECYAGEAKGGFEFSFIPLMAKGFWIKRK
ncbi:hypothetical protein DYBT9275_02233 [Dyadobacter sp. CECT 9275]|uniref:Rhamnogalacturonan lyase family 11 C-terminal domain-containing protein n=2 Tax=Dyadobacter helix TaxID=2822344 RepID=A0A916JC72_9BACT|nr:hypothetical protein DYBT9275_02233 [Dyadobacter sp. CECT 9275]